MASSPKPRPVYVLLEAGKAVAFTQNKREADNWLFAEDNDYTTFENLSDVPADMKLAMLNERIAGLTNRLNRLDEHRAKHNTLGNRLLGRKVPPMPKPTDDVEEYGFESGHGHGGFFLRNLNFSGWYFWPQRKKA